MIELCRFFFYKMVFFRHLSCALYFTNAPWFQHVRFNWLRYLGFCRSVIFVFLVLLPMASKAVEPGEVLLNSSLELRARSISAKLRCLVCQNQSIDDSDAVLARDLRILVRERLVAGDSDNQIIDYVVSRYGDFVLLIPPFKPITYMLWLSPCIILIVALFWFIIFFRNSKNVTTEMKEKFSTDEKNRLDELMSDPIE